MPSNVSDYGGSFIAGLVFGAAYAIPTTYYMALTQGAPDPSVSGTALSEPASTTGYARVAIPNSSVSFAAPSGGSVTNSGTLTFPAATADWGVLAWYVICDAAAGGNIIMYASLDMPRAILSGSTVSFQPGQLSLSVTGVRRTIIGGSV